MFDLMFISLDIMCLLYFYYKILQIKYIKKIESKIIKHLISIGICLILFSISFIKLYAIPIIYVHVFIFMLIFDIIFYFINKNREKKYYKYNFIAIGLSFVYILISLFLGLSVYKKTYDINTLKSISNLKIAQISDSHIGNTIDGDKFIEYIKKIDKENVDLLVITGDFVDDDTKKEDMVKSCYALSLINTKYGVYFVYGNHDRGYYSYRDFNTSDLENELIKNNVKILVDEYVMFDEFCLIGRNDKKYPRKNMDLLLTGIDTNKYMILLDHQPADYENEKGKVDLVLSGHTHGGNLFPAHLFISFLNDQVYGKKEIDNTTFIVSSGISDWGMPFKNFCNNEYVIINIVGRK